jgi:16S rRNA (guanine1207-N2)-methyltransferase
MKSITNTLIIEKINTFIKDQGAYLWIVDENITSSELGLIHSSLRSKIDILSNRFDLCQHAHTLGYKTTIFDDFSFSSQQSYRYVFIRAPKEKIQCLHILSSAHNLLDTHGSLYFSVKKNEGLKSYINYLEINNFNYNIEQKIKQTALIHIKKEDKNTKNISDYHNETSLVYNGFSLLTKPGQYGWKKIDRASLQLVDYFPSIYKTYKPKTFLDLGCGYGLLTVATHEYDLERVATDNNAAAIYCCTKNCELLKLKCTVIADNIGSTITKQFDWIVCNPPFHIGFEQSNKLLILFLTQAYRLISNDGITSFVTNEFIPVEREGRKIFPYVKRIETKKGFCIYLLSKKNIKSLFD